MEEEHVKFSYDHSEPYHPESHTSISNEYLERQCIEGSNLIQSMEGQPELAFFGLEVPYDLEYPRAYMES